MNKEHNEPLDSNMESMAPDMSSEQGEGEVIQDLSAQESFQDVTEEPAPKAEFLQQIESLVGEHTGVADKTIFDAETIKDAMSEQITTLAALEAELQSSLAETQARKSSLSVLYNSINKGLVEIKPKRTFWQKVTFRGPSA